MISLHSPNCTCACHDEPGSTRMEIVHLQQDNTVNHRRFSHAELVGFTNPNGLRCRSCGQYYGADNIKDPLRPIEGNTTVGSHPDLPKPFPHVAPLAWRLMSWFTPAYAPLWLREKIREGLQPKEWEIVTKWTMR